jgi:hypothetical protein
MTDEDRRKAAAAVEEQSFLGDVQRAADGIIEKYPKDDQAALNATLKLSPELRNDVRKEIRMRQIDRDQIAGKVRREADVSDPVVWFKGFGMDGGRLAEKTQRELWDEFRTELSGDDWEKLVARWNHEKVLAGKQVGDRASAARYRSADDRIKTAILREKIASSLDEKKMTEEEKKDVMTFTTIALDALEAEASRDENGKLSADQENAAVARAALAFQTEGVVGGVIYDTKKKVRKMSEDELGAIRSVKKVDELDAVDRDDVINDMSAAGFPYDRSNKEKWNDAIERAYGAYEMGQTERYKRIIRGEE